MAQMTRPTQGVQIIEEALGAPPISTANFSAIGIAGTAPKAAGKFLNKAKDGIAYNQPFYITKRSDAADLGNEGTLPLALDSIFAQGSVGVVVVIVEEVATAPALDLDDLEYVAAGTAFDASNPPQFKIVDNVIQFGQAAPLFGSSYATKVNLLRKGQLITIDKTPALGVAPVYEVTADGPYTTIGSGNTAYLPVPVKVFTDGDALTAGTGFTMDAPKQDGAAKTQTNVRGDSGKFTGIWAFLAAGTEVGVTPRIIATPGIDNGTQQTGGEANALGKELETVAGKIRAIAIIDLPNDKETVIRETTGAAAGYNGDRTVLVSPAARMAKPGSEDTIEFAMSGFVAGKIAVNDSEQGFWTPIGNKSLAGVLGLAVPVDFQMDNPNSGAQDRINAGTITVINFGGGFRTWGDATPATTDKTAPYRFVNVRRIGDILAYSIQVNHLWAVSKAMGKNYLSEVAENVNAFIRKLKAQGALRGGFCYPDGELNTPQAIANGEAYFNLEYTPVYPATSITFSVQLTNKYLAE